jgi:glycosyltransferase involved in cell wall biosynthesis
MKILHLSGTYEDDGASTSIINLNNSLKESKFKSNIFLLKSKTKSSKNVNYLNSNLISNIKFYLLSKIEYFFLKIIKKKKNFAFFNNIIESDIFYVIDKIKPDIVHFHWIPRLTNIKKISSIDTKVIVTLRDYWMITGGCNYPVNCDQFKKTCTICPHLKNLYLKKDISYFNFIKKRNFILDNKNKLNIVVPNHEMYTELVNLNIFKKEQIHLIPNGINSDEFFPTDKNLSKEKLGLPLDKKIILFGAQDLDQEWKGIKYVVDLSKIIDKSKYLFISFGKINSLTKKEIQKNQEYLDFGYISSNKKLRELYNASDFFLFPSTIESFGKVILESIFCKTPVIAFNKYAAKDIITHGVDGYLIDEYDARSFKIAIDYLNNNKNEEQLISLNKEKTKNYCMKNISKLYSNLYNSV